MTILVLGGGASGMMAALTAAESGKHRVMLVERQARVGRKLLATGNGRCNLTNLHAGPTRYHGQEAAFCEPALEKFDVQATLAFFASLGLITVAEPSGRVYPFSDQANSVVDVLRFALEQRGVEVHTSCEVTKLWKRRDGYLLKTTGGDFAGEKLIVAAGGAAGGKLGGTMDGYEILQSLGHHCTRLFPALVQLVTAETVTRALKGIRAQAQVRLLHRGEILAESRGEIQFTETGVSGPAIFEISRAASAGPSGTQIHLDLTPQMTWEQLSDLLLQKQALLPQHGSEDLLTGILHNRLGKILVREAGIPADLPMEQLSAHQLRCLAALVKDFILTYNGTQGMDSAQVTAGGITTAEFDPETLESRLAPGVYACGEVLDIDGDCGGFNLQWAWSSGRLAGSCAAQEDGR
jgi:predicted Rossmann fold flavoprotein